MTIATPPSADNMGAQLLRAWMAENEVTQFGLATRCAEFASKHGVPIRLDTRQKVNHLSRARRRPTASQAVVLQHICGIEPGDWYRRPEPNKEKL